MPKKRKLFGTDGIRGKANIYPMTGEVAFALGRAVTYYFQKFRRNQDPTIIIGKDTRLSCYMLEQAFSSGVCAQGGRAILTGPLPTPGVAFVTKSMRAEAGVMISASHNSFSDNGIKIFDHEGFKLPDSVELELERMVLNQDLLPTKIDAELGRAKRLDEVIGRYIVHVKNAVSDSFTLEGMRIVVDSANGSAYKIAPMVFEELGAEVIRIGDRPDGQNINLNCGATSPHKCKEAVTKYRADLGICLDGDADRLVIIDDQGHVVHGDQLIGLLGRYLSDLDELDEDKHVIGTVMSNIGLELYLKNLGVTFDRVKVGDRYIFEKMLQNKAVFGGEPSGHLIFRNYATTGDGILAALKVIECVKFYDTSLQELLKPIKLFPQVLKNVKVASKPAFENNKNITSAVKDVENTLGDSGRVILRYSGTEPLARVMIEGENEEQVHTLCQDLAKVVSSEIGG